jgi:hypothetical protein
MLPFTLIGSGGLALAQNTVPSGGEQPASTRPPPPSFEILQGRWMRPDGGYLIVIKGIDSAGKVDAAYFNPSPLPFSKSDATLSGSTLNLFFELRAGGYAGSTYTLTYDPTRDRLVGVYFQAVAQQKFDIYFIRIR